MNELLKRCFNSLCDICATRGVLPKICRLDRGKLQWPEKQTYTGGFGIVWEGTYRGKAVAIKQLNVTHSTSKKVRCSIEVMCKDV
jgi:hypothetical protein